jgi:hypothetical protein
MTQTQNQTGSQGTPMAIPPHFEIRINVDAGGFDALRSALGTLPYNVAAKFIEHIENQVREQIVAFNAPTSGEANTESPSITGLTSAVKRAVGAKRGAPARGRKITGKVSAA